jgi:peptidoglycan/LPS O-acetylase OafA/YrhL
MTAAVAAGTEMVPAKRPHNNFDLIRLIAAAQVMTGHLLLHFGYSHSIFFRIIDLFPGVPVFFAISGYLVSASYDRSVNIADYARRRFLRIFPALWGALVFSAVSVALLHPIEAETFIPWLAGQATFLQDWHPDALRSYGVGVVNGSLWSVPVEMFFYAALPALAPLRSRVLAVIAAAAFAMLYISWNSLSGFPLRLALVSPPPWLGMFLCGILLRRSGYRPRVGPWAVAFLAVILLSLTFPIPGVLGESGNGSGVINFVAIAGLAFGAAFTRPLHLPADISYGFYLYHMPVLNALLAIGWSGQRGLVATFAITVVIALLSCALIERPALAIAASRPARWWRPPAYCPSTEAAPR